MPVESPLSLRGILTAARRGRGDTPLLRPGAPLTAEDATRESLEREAASLSSLGKGFRSGIEGLYGNVQEFAGTAAEAAGADELSKNLYTAAERNAQRAQILRPEIGETPQINSLRDLGHYIAGHTGQAAASTLPAFAVGGGLGLRAALAGRQAMTVPNYIASSATMFPQEAGETAAEARRTLPNVTPGERLAASTGAGAVNAALENVLPHLGLRRLLMRRAGRGVLPAAAGVVADTGAGSGAEGVTEYMQTATKHAALSQLDPNRDTSGDAYERMQSFFAGAAGGGGVKAPAAVTGAVLDAGLPEAVRRLPGQAGDLALRAGRGAADLGARGAAAAGGVALDAARDLAQGVGQPLAEAHERNVAMGEEARASGAGIESYALAGEEITKKAVDRVERAATAGGNVVRSIMDRGRRWLDEQGAEVEEPGTTSSTDNVQTLQEKILATPRKARAMRDSLLKSENLSAQEKQELAALGDDFSSSMAVNTVRTMMRRANTRADTRDATTSFNQGVNQAAGVPNADERPAQFSRQRTFFHDAMDPIFPGQPETVNELAGYLQMYLRQRADSTWMAKFFKRAEEAGLTPEQMNDLQDAVADMLPGDTQFRGAVAAFNPAAATEAALSAQRSTSVLSQEVDRILNEHLTPEDADLGAIATQLKDYATKALFGNPDTKDFDPAEFRKRGRRYVYALLSEHTGLSGTALRGMLNDLVTAFSVHFSASLENQRDVGRVQAALRDAFNIPGETASPVDWVVDNLTPQGRKQLAEHLGKGQSSLAPLQETQFREPELRRFVGSLLNLLADAKRVGLRAPNAAERNKELEKARVLHDELVRQGKPEEARRVLLEAEHRAADSGANLRSYRKRIIAAFRPLFGDNSERVYRELSNMQLKREKDIEQGELFGGVRGGNPDTFSYGSYARLDDEFADTEQDIDQEAAERSGTADEAELDAKRENEQGTQTEGALDFRLAGDGLPLYRSDRRAPRTASPGGGDSGAASKLGQLVKESGYGKAHVETPTVKRYLESLPQSEAEAEAQRMFDGIAQRDARRLKTLLAEIDDAEARNMRTDELRSELRELRARQRDLSRYSPLSFFTEAKSSGVGGRLVVVSNVRGTEADVSPAEFERLQDSVTTADPSKNFLVITAQGKKVYVNAERLTRLVLAKTQSGNTLITWKDATPAEKAFAAFQTGISILQTGGLLSEENPFAIRPPGEQTGRWARIQPSDRENPEGRMPNVFPGALVLFSADGTGRAVKDLTVPAGAPVTFGAMGGVDALASKASAVVNFTPQIVGSIVRETPAGVGAEALADRGQIANGLVKDDKRYTLDLRALMRETAAALGMDGLDAAINRGGTSVGISRALAADLIVRGMEALERAGFQANVTRTANRSIYGAANANVKLFERGPESDRTPVLLKSLNLDNYQPGTYPGDYTLKTDRYVALNEYRQFLIANVVPADMRKTNDKQVRRMLKRADATEPDVDLLDAAEAVARGAQRTVRGAKSRDEMIAAHLTGFYLQQQRLASPSLSSAEAQEARNLSRRHAVEMRRLTEGGEGGNLAREFRKLAWVDRELAREEKQHDRIDDRLPGLVASEIDDIRMRSEMTEGRFSDTPEGQTTLFDRSVAGEGTAAPSHDTRMVNQNRVLGRQVRENIAQTGQEQVAQPATVRRVQPEEPSEEALQAPQRTRLERSGPADREAPRTRPAAPTPPREARLTAGRTAFPGTTSYRERTRLLLDAQQAVAAAPEGQRAALQQELRTLTEAMQGQRPTREHNQALTKLWQKATGAPTEEPAGAAARGALSHHATVMSRWTGSKDTFAGKLAKLLERLEPDPALRDAITAEINALPEGERTPGMKAFLEAVGTAKPTEGISEEQLRKLYDLPPKLPPNAAFQRGNTRQARDASAETQNAIRNRLQVLIAAFAKVAFPDDPVNAGKFEKALTEEGVKRLVSISTFARDPLSTANHEGWHVLADVLRDTEIGTKLVNMVHRAVSTPLMRSWLNARYVGDEEALRQMNVEGTEDQQAAERAAYAFQLFAAGHTMPAPEAAKGLWKRALGWFKKLLGITDDHAKLLKLFGAFHSGMLKHELGNMEALSRYLALTQREQFTQKLEEAVVPLRDVASRLLSVSIDRVRAVKNEAYQQIVDRYAGPAQGRGGFFRERRRMDNAFANELRDLIDSVTEGANDPLRESYGIYLRAQFLERGKKDQTQTNLVLDELRNALTAGGVENVDAVINLFRRNAEKLLAFPEKLRAYQKEAGVEPTLYWGYDRGEIAARRAEFVADVLAANKDRTKATVEADLLKYSNFAAFPHFFDLRTDAGRTMFMKWSQPDVQEAYNDMIRHSVLRAEEQRWLNPAGQPSLKALQSKVRGTASADEIELLQQFEASMYHTLGADKMPDALRQASNGLMIATNIALLPWGMFSQFLDIMQLSSRSNNLTAAFEAFKRGVRDIPRMSTWVENKFYTKDYWEKLTESLGLISASHMAGYMSDVLMGGRAGYGALAKLNDGFFRYNGMAGWQRSMIVAAVKNAHDFLVEHKGLPSKHSARLLQELGLTPEDIKLTKEGGLDVNDKKIQQAISQYVSEAIAVPDPTTLPMWMNDPRFALLAHLKRFTFAYATWILGRVAREAGRFKNWMVLLPMILAVPWMLAVDVVRDAITPQSEAYKASWGFMDYLRRGIERASLLGRYQFGADVSRSLEYGGTGIDAIVGPEFQLATQMLGANKHGGIGSAWTSIITGGRVDGI